MSTGFLHCRPAKLEVDSGNFSLPAQTFAAAFLGSLSLFPSLTNKTLLVATRKSTTNFTRTIDEILSMTSTLPLPLWLSAIELHVAIDGPAGVLKQEGSGSAGAV